MQPIAHGQTVRDWTGGGAADNYNSALNRSSFDVPDTARESARFNLPGGFDVTLQSGINLTVDDLSILAGDINFAATASVFAFYTVNDDLTVDGGNFTLSNSGGIGNVLVTANDELTVGQDSLLTLGTGGGINANGSGLIDGDTLSTKISTGSSFNLAANQTLTARNSGVVTFDADVTLPADTTWQFQSAIGRRLRCISDKSDPFTARSKRKATANIAMPPTHRSYPDHARTDDLKQMLWASRHRSEKRATQWHPDHVTATRSTRTSARGGLPPSSRSQPNHRLHDRAVQTLAARIFEAGNDHSA